MNRSPRILVVDDDPAVVAWLVESLGEEGFRVAAETSAREALAHIERVAFDAVVSDIEMPELRGIELLKLIHAKRPRVPVLFITAFGSIDLAVEAVRSGATDLLAKPFRVEVLALALKRALRDQELKRELVRLREGATTKSSNGIVANSSAMRHVLGLAHRVASSALPILITGESGAGKGALARFIHDEGARRAGPFVQMNCAALPAGIAEAELFGARRGAFTDAKEDRAGLFEQAHRGTLFLDELGELPLELQPKLLQVLETGKVRPLGGGGEVATDVRVIVATNRPLEEAMQERQFRPDLYHRVNVIRLEIPPLRERIEDIEGLVDVALARIRSRSGQSVAGVSLGAMQWLRSQQWPGNVRELINAVERASAFATEEMLELSDFTASPATVEGTLAGAIQGDITLEELERRYIQAVMVKTGGHKGRAAQILGLDRRTLYRKLALLEGRSDVDAEPKAP